MTVIHSPARLTAIVALGLAVAALTTPARAQSERALRAENETLRTQVKDLQAELEAAIASIERLEAQVAQLQGQLRAARSGSPIDTPPPVIEVSIDESVPEASPRALFNALKASYDEDLGELETGAPDSREHIAYMRALESWVAKVNRRFRTQIEWHVDLLEAMERRRGWAVRMAAVDPVTDARLGDPFWSFVPRHLARRADQLMQRSEGPYVMRGVLTPEVRVNRERPDVGAFNHPPLIGPYAEFIFVVQANSITAPEDDEKDGEEESKP